MWKMQSLMRSTGKSIFRLFRSACFLFCFSLSVIDSTAQSTTNVDFIVVGSAYWLDGQCMYDTIPTGCLLFWSIKPDDAERASIYRSESGHIAFVQSIDRGYGSEDWLILADSNGSPMPWFVNSGWRRSYQISLEGGGSATKYAVYPGIISKHAFDCIPCDTLTGTGCYLHYLATRPVFAGYGLLARSGNIGFAQYGGGGGIPIGIGAVWGRALDYRWISDDAVYEASVINFDGPLESMQLRWAFRASSFIISLDAFKMHLPSKWWLAKKFTVSPGNGIVAINVPGGTGMGGQGEGENSGPAVPSEGGSGVGGSVPGDITNPPVTPFGENGKWVYDPETKMWNWVGDFADNAGQLNPWDNSVMPENQERGLAQEATLRQVKDGIEQIRMTLEEFQKQQGITGEQLQAMIDNAVVEIVDGYVQYWQGQNLVGAIDNQGQNLVGAIDNQGQNLVDVIDDRVSGVIGRLSIEGVGIKNAINQHKEISSAISSRVIGLDNSVSRVNTSIGEAKTDIVNAISDITMPENPTVDGQDVESYEITTPDLSSQIDGWFSFSFPQLTIARTFIFEDYEIGVFDWKIPFSAFNNSSLRVMINTVRNILAWLVYLSAVLGVFKAMGGGV